jgi:hypothetical protein
VRHHCMMGLYQGCIIWWEPLWCRLQLGHLGAWVHAEVIV